MMTISEYLKWAKGRRIDTDGVPAPPDNPYQCADVIKCAMERCWGIKGFAFTTRSNPKGYAKGLYENFDEYPQLKGKFIRIENTPDYVPKKGDIIEWRGNAKTTSGKPVTGKAGHTALAEGINEGTTYFYSLDQNWGGKEFCTVIKHNYTGVLGCIRSLLKCTTANLNVRSGAGTAYPVIDELPKGTLVKPLEYKGNWARIGENKWCSAKYLD